jgi:hypothetical protein
MLAHRPILNFGLSSDIKISLCLQLRNAENRTALSPMGDALASNATVNANSPFPLTWLKPENASLQESDAGSG